MAEVVVDASAVLAVVQREPGAEVVLGKPSLTISAVNLAEARSKLVDKGFTREAIDLSMALFPLSVVAFDTEQAEATADLRRATKAFGLSLGDRACLALAASRDAVALTADRAWAEAGLAVKIELVR